MNSSAGMQALFLGITLVTHRREDIVKQVANELRVKYNPERSEREIEVEIAKKVMETVWEEDDPFPKGSDGERMAKGCSRI